MAQDISSALQPDQRPAVVFVVYSEQTRNNLHDGLTFLGVPCLRNHLNLLNQYPGITIYGIFETIEEARKCIEANVITNTKKYNKILSLGLPQVTDLSPQKSRVLFGYFDSDTALLPGVYGVPIYVFLQLMKMGYAVRLPTMEEIDQISSFPLVIPIIPQVLDDFNSLKTPGFCFTTSNVQEDIEHAKKKESDEIVASASRGTKIILSGQVEDLDELICLMTDARHIQGDELDNLKKKLLGIITGVKVMRSSGKSEEDIAKAVTQAITIMFCR